MFWTSALRKRAWLLILCEISSKNCSWLCDSSLWHAPLLAAEGCICFLNKEQENNTGELPVIGWKPWF